MWVFVHVYCARFRKLLSTVSWEHASSRLLTGMRRAFGIDGWSIGFCSHRKKTIIESNEIYWYFDL